MGTTVEPTSLLGMKTDGLPNTDQCNHHHIHQFLSVSSVACSTPGRCEIDLSLTNRLNLLKHFGLHGEELRDLPGH